jgi:hypothetical protein
MCQTSGTWWRNSIRIIYSELIIMVPFYRWFISEPW